MPANNKQRARSRERPSKEQERAIGQDHDESHGFDAGGHDGGEAQGDEQPPWHERAAFDVTFEYMEANGDGLHWRTRAYHNESDATSEWPGIADAHLVSWMRIQGDLPEADTIIDPPGRPAADLPAYGDDSLEGPKYGDNSLEGPKYGDDSLEDQREEVAAKLAEPDTSQPPEIAESGASLSLGEIYLIEVAAQAAAGLGLRSGQSTVRRLRGQISFSVVDEAGIQATIRGSPYIVQFLGYDLHTGEQHMLGTEWGQTKPFVDQYTCTTEFDLPAVGRYRIMATVVLPDEGVAGLAVGPILTVAL
ncbi:MAG: hypothetical protein HGA45_22000 [Chloroflexales bacterium]|nr:hypothetical protein [Chloroflexales bacterium]